MFGEFKFFFFVGTYQNIPVRNRTVRSSWTPFHGLHQNTGLRDNQLLTNSCFSFQRSGSFLGGINVERGILKMFPAQAQPAEVLVSL